jgi:negative regulator of sigma E activity
MSELRDSQLSAMFDDELPGGECELLALRLSRDEPLRAEWSRFAIIRAAVRRDGVRLDLPVAARVTARLAAEPAHAEPSTVLPNLHAPEPAASGARPTGTPIPSTDRWLRPALGFGVAAGVAAVSLLVLRAQGPAESVAPLAASPATVAPAPASPERTGAATTPAAVAEPTPLLARTPGLGEPESYTVPSAGSRSGLVAPAQLATYVVAHSEVSMPLSRRNLLSALVADGAAEEPVVAEAESPAEAVDAQR